LNTFALIVALLWGFNVSDCQSGYIDTYFEDTSYMVVADSSSVTCQKSTADTEITVAIRMTSTSTFYAEHIVQPYSMPFPESVAWWDTYGSLRGNYKIKVIYPQ
jgi:hypothetical protein